MTDYLKVDSFSNSGVRNAAYVADNTGNMNGRIDTREEFEAIFNFYEKSKPMIQKRMKEWKILLLQQIWIG